MARRSNVDEIENEDDSDEAEHRGPPKPKKKKKSKQRAVADQEKGDVERRGQPNGHAGKQKTGAKAKTKTADGTLRVGRPLFMT